MKCTEGCTVHAYHWRCGVCDRIVPTGVKWCPTGCNPADALARILKDIK